ncbi:MAG: NUDIX hydrolase, partial [Clostridia bacterium]|nr:NUDIX hydrolase [Clostridia bacterium]
ELREETGIQAEQWTKLNDLYTTVGFCDECISIYLATGLTRGSQHLDPDEFLNVVRIPFAEALRMAEKK